MAERTGHYFNLTMSYHHLNDVVIPYGDLLPLGTPAECPVKSSHTLDNTTAAYASYLQHMRRYDHLRKQKGGRRADHWLREETVKRLRQNNLLWRIIPEQDSDEDEKVLKKMSKMSSHADSAQKVSHGLFSESGTVERRPQKVHFDDVNEDRNITHSANMNYDKQNMRVSETMVSGNAGENVNNRHTNRNSSTESARLFDSNNQSEVGTGSDGKDLRLYQINKTGEVNTSKNLSEQNKLIKDGDNENPERNAWQQVIKVDMNETQNNIGSEKTRNKRSLKKERNENDTSSDAKVGEENDAIEQRNNDSDKENGDEDEQEDAAMTLRNILTEEEIGWATRPKLAVWMASHCPSMSQREQLVQSLQQWVNITTVGTCGQLRSV